MDEIILRRIAQTPGDIGFYYKNLVTGETAEYGADRRLLAASVIKLPIMAEAFRRFYGGEMDEGACHAVRAEEKKPSCGALNCLHEGLTVTNLDLVTLMIILSDNTATNILLDKMGIANVNALLDRLDMPLTRVERKLFDSEGAARGLQNRVTAREMGRLLEMMYRGELVSPEASARMLTILSDQRLNGKIPFVLHTRGVKVAHKTGEDDGITHDVGIVFAREPFVVCFLSNNTDVCAYERVMQEVSDQLALGK